MEYDRIVLTPKGVFSACLLMCKIIDTIDDDIIDKCFSDVQRNLISGGYFELDGVDTNEEKIEIDMLDCMSIPLRKYFPDCSEDDIKECFKMFCEYFINQLNNQ